MPFVTLAGVILLAACASHPAGSAAPAAATATPGATAAPGAGRSALAATAHAGKAKKVSFPGYQRVVVKGQALFCKYQSVTGSRIRQRTCLTRSDLQAQENRAQEFLQQSRQYSASCTTTLTPGGGANCEP